MNMGPELSSAMRQYTCTEIFKHLKIFSAIFSVNNFFENSDNKFIEWCTIQQRNVAQ